ncbi:VWA domain-containing protein [Algibacter mikhailovii]|uniref:VWA domain-containing protein n=1 Tax=Algibacter mikhailovii TaxID=425498 RepID=A0A918QVN9_9FLAO|nr:VWA domain-containing protein [Algibacter mikhailovii]GGZ69337.1 hypothetical protein GCM10007028_02930 [Algibacter mikhailovii]
MQTEIVLYIVIAGIIAFLLARFQYLNKQKSVSKRYMLFIFLRCIAIFAILLLIINPTFNKTSFSIEKPNLVLAIDNSSSIKYLGHENGATTLINELRNNSSLNEKFDLNIYSFGKDLKSSDSITFSENQTNISQAFEQLSQVYYQSIAPTLLLTDGNQTYGNDYEMYAKTYNQPIFPIILGDTITYIDLKIQQLNVNKYTFLNNKFPVEAILNYTGTKTINTRFQLKFNDKVIHEQPISFSKNENSKIINITLPANKVGVLNLEASIQPLENERNKINNSKKFAIEVLSQKTKIAIISDIAHPDIGAFKKSLESNEQRLIEILEPNSDLANLTDFQLYILYQPNRKFDKVIEFIKSQKQNALFVVGSKTDLNFLNRISKNYSFDITNQYENYQAELNTNYAPFLIDDIDFQSFPPLYSNYGDVNFIRPVESILNKTINGLSLNTPLLATIEDNGIREAIFLGENIWQWRAQSYLNEDSFELFDKFLGKVIQYLASNTLKSRLNIDYQSFYDGNSNLIIKAEYFDKNYAFDNRETLTITVVDEQTKEKKVFPLVLKYNYYQVDLSNLPASKYSFKIETSGSKISKTGSFTVLDFNVEQQFINANVNKLKKLATNSEGKEYFISGTNTLVEDLLIDSRFVPIQKSNKKDIPLIDWKYLLAIIALALGAEWFLRKYHGLI